MGLTADNFWFDGLVRSGGQAANRKIRDKEELKMKVKTNTVLVVVALLTYWIGLCNTHAYYDPRMQRWLNRDPLGELGFELVRRKPASLRAGGPNRYVFIANNSISQVDPLGLCNINLRCGPVSRAGVTLGYHCGVIAPNGVEYGLGGGDQSSGSSGTATPYPTDPNQGSGTRQPNQVDYPVSCPGKSCDEVQKAIQNYHDTVTPPSYNALGPNSDTYAHNMLNAAGCSVNPITPPPVVTCPANGGTPIVYQPPPTTTPPGTIGW